MSAPLKMISDMRRALEEFREMQEKSELSGFDLHSYLGLLMDLGFAVAEINRVSTDAAGCRIVHYKLCEGLKIALTALRARDPMVDKIERRSGLLEAGTLDSGATSDHYKAPLILVTDEMIGAGRGELDIFVAQDIVDGFANRSDVVSAIYRAMTLTRPQTR